MDIGLYICVETRVMMYKYAAERPIVYIVLGLFRLFQYKRFFFIVEFVGAWSTETKHRKWCVP